MAPPLALGRHTRMIASLLLLSFSTCIESSSQLLCAKNSIDTHLDCSSLINSFNPRSACSIEYFPTNSSECMELKFDSDSATFSLGRVRLKPVRWSYNKSSLSLYTVFEVTFSDIKWTNASFRFTNENIPRKNHCRRILLNNVANSSDIELVYDCFWSLQNNNYEGQNFVFEYNFYSSGDVQYGKYHFIVPSLNEIELMHKECQPFMYYDLQDLEYIHLHLINLNENCDMETYFITVVTERGNTTTQIDYDRSSRETVFEYARVTSGKLNFIVSINESDSSKSLLAVSNLNITPNEYITLICLLWVFGCISVILLITFGVFMWYRYRNFVNKNSKILLFHSPGTMEDNDVFEILVKYLKNDLKFEVLSEKDIKFTTHKDPALWSINACSKSDIFIYIINPSLTDVPSNEIYVDVDKKIFEIIKNNTQFEKKIIIVNFGIYDKNKIPDELLGINIYNIFKDWNSIYSLLRGYNYFDSKIFPVPNFKKSISGKRLFQLVQCIKSYS